MKLLIKSIYLLFLIGIHFSVFSTEIIPEAQKKEMIRIGSKNLNELIQQNKRNDAVNASQNNIYLFYTYTNDGDIKDPSKLLSTSDFNTLNAELISYNNQLKGKAKIYVALNGKIIYTLKNNIKLEKKGSLKLSELKEYSTQSVHDKVKKELGKVYGKILETSESNNVIVSSLGWFTTVSLANVKNYKLNTIEQDYKNKVLKNKIYLESYLQLDFHYKQGDYLTESLYQNITKSIPSSTRKNISKYGVGKDLNSKLLTDNLSALNTHLFKKLEDPSSAVFCLEGEEFLNTYSEITDDQITQELHNIASLICDSEADPDFFKQFVSKGYTNLLHWQKQFYDEGAWANDYEAYHKFYKSYQKYLEYYKQAKNDINTVEDREALLLITYNLTTRQLEELTAAEKLRMLKIIVSSSLSGYFTGVDYNSEALALKIIKSITNNREEKDQISTFLDGLYSPAYKNDNDLLYVALFKGLDNFFGAENFTTLILKFTDLALEAKGLSTTDQISTAQFNTLSKTQITWDVENKSFLWVFKSVNDKTKVGVQNTQDQTKIHIRCDCLNWTTRSRASVCSQYRVDDDFSPFEFVSLYIIKDITFNPETATMVTSGDAILVPAVFLAYLDESRSSTILQNRITNTLTAASFYFSGSQIIAAKGVLTVATLPAYADLFVTISNPYFSSPDFIAHASSTAQSILKVDQTKGQEIGVALQVLWTVGSTALTLNTAKDLATPKKHIEALATYKALTKKIGVPNAKRIIAQDPDISQKVIDGFIRVERELIKVGKKADLDAAELKATQNLEELLKGSNILTGNLATQLKRFPKLEEQLNTLSSTAQKDFLADHAKATEALINKIGKNPDYVKAWNVLKGFKTIRQREGNIDVLLKVHKRFEYNQKQSFEGLYDLFNGSAASKQNLIDGLAKVDGIFDPALPVKFSGIKAGDVTVKTVDGVGDEVARIVKGNIVPKKFLDQGTVAGKYKNDEILRNGDEVGFRAPLSNARGKIGKRLDDIGLGILTKKLDDLGDTTKARFLDDFADASDDVLKKFNNDDELVDVWSKWRDKGVVKITDIESFKRVWNRTVRNVSFDDFYNKTFYQIGKVPDKKFSVELYETWAKGKGNEKALQNIYKKYGLDPSVEYPPCEGVWGITKIETPSSNQLFDRFQTRENLGGGYAGVIENPSSSFTISSRALKENYSELLEQGESYFYFKFKVKNSSSDLKFEYGEAMPWFEEIGGALQIKSSKGLHQLTEQIEIIEKWSLLNGKWVQIK